MLDAHASKILTGRYTYGDEQAEDTFKRVASFYGTDYRHSERLLGYFERLWAVPASPILANGGTGRALPISCFLLYVPDSREGLCDHYEETLWVGTNGGGLGSSWADVRSAGQKTSRNTVTTGAMQFMHIADAYTLACNQGSTRQASYAAYLDISHPEILEFISMRKTSGGDVHRKCLNLHHGINITDSFMEAVLCDEEWQLIDPHSKQVCNTVQARDVWEQIIETRLLTGEPYLFFIDEANRKMHQDLKDQELKITGSNLCTEITLPTSDSRTAVCCLSSVNLEKYDEWKDNKEFIHDMVEFLDNVLEDFIQNAPPQLHKAVYSAIQERSIGLGAMGFHSYLQKNMIPIESMAAIGINLQMFDFIKSTAMEANVRLAESRGPALGLSKDRFAHLLAIAPNASTSIIAGTSPSTEPWAANIFIQKTASGALTVKNKFLNELLIAKASSMHSDASNEAVQVQEWWNSILSNGGSVAHLDFLSEWERDTFKTAVEIDQRALVKLASDRQQFVCQAQSVNLFFPSGASLDYINKVHIQAWKAKLKSLYYLRTVPVRKGSMVSFDTSKDCTGCQG
jgi:ribonucleoside-diphosphate reductase alpha chain